VSKRRSGRRKKKGGWVPVFGDVRETLHRERNAASSLYEDCYPSPKRRNTQDMRVLSRETYLGSIDVREGKRSSASPVRKDEGRALCDQKVEEQIEERRRGGNVEVGGEVAPKPNQNQRKKKKTPKKKKETHKRQTDRKKKHNHNPKKSDKCVVSLVQGKTRAEGGRVKDPANHS